MRRTAFRSTAAFFAIAGLGAAARAAFVINIVPGATLAANAPAMAAFNRAAAEWEANITSNMTVTINADLTTFTNNSLIGTTSPSELIGSYTSIRNAMVAKAAGQPNDAILSALPTSAQFQSGVVLPAGRSFNGNMLITTANAKALGFSTVAASDATITFNQAFSFDYDNSNGVDSGKVDFQSAAAHEIGHALGFVSALDDIDAANGDPTQHGITSVSPFPLDLFRFNRSSLPTTPAQFAAMGRDLTPGHDDATADTVNAFRMSSGEVSIDFPATTGTDGNEDSHWKADELNGNANLGIMDPTLANGASFAPTADDFRALDLIGFSVNVAVPEPASLALLLLGFALLLRRPLNETRLAVAA